MRVRCCIPYSVTIIRRYLMKSSEFINKIKSLGRRAGKKTLIAGCAVLVLGCAQSALSSSLLTPQNQDCISSPRES